MESNKEVNRGGCSPKLIAAAKQRHWKKLRKLYVSTGRDRFLFPELMVGLGARYDDDGRHGSCRLISRSVKYGYVEKVHTNTYRICKIPRSWRVRRFFYVISNGLLS